MSSALRKPLDLYYLALSHPCRLVMLTVKQLNIEDKVNIKSVDLLKKKQHLEKDFTSINPDHTVPTLVDHETGLTLWESRAIATYLITKYQPKSSLLPSDLVNRALVDRCIHHDGSSLFPALRMTYLPFFRENRKTEEAKIETLKEKLRTMDSQFVGKNFAVGDDLTIADLCYIVTLDLFYNVRHLIHVEETYPNLLKYVNNLKSKLPYYKEVAEDATREYVSILEGLAKAVGQWSP